MPPELANAGTPQAVAQPQPIPAQPQLPPVPAGGLQTLPQSIPSIHQQLQAGIPLTPQQTQQLQSGASGQPQNLLSKAQVAQIIQNAPSGVQPVDIVNALVNKGYQLEGYNPPSTQPGQLQDTGNFITNALNSGANFIGQAASAVGNVFNPHPNQNTVVNLGKLGVGLGENAINLGARVLNGNQSQPFNNQATQMASGVGQYFNNRWGVNDLLTGNLQGALQKITNTIYTDPVGAGADLSMLLDAGGALATSAGKSADLANGAALMDAGAPLSEVSAAGGSSALSKIGNIATTASGYVNPVSLAGKAISGAAGLGGDVAAGVLGNTSGMGYGNAKQLLSGNDAAAAAMRGNEIDEEGLVNTLQGAYENMRAQKLADYKDAVSNISQKYMGAPTSLDGLTQMASPLSLDSVRSTIADSFSKDFNISIGKDGALDFSQSVIPRTAYTTVQHIYDDVQGWKDTSPQGINNLENKIKGYWKTGNEPVLNRFINSVDGTIKGYLRERIPEFEAADAQYANVSSLMKQVKQVLHVGGNAQPQTILNTVLKIANNDEDMRQALVQEISAATGKDIEGIAAGLKAHDIMPKGIFSKGLEVFGLFHPSLWLPLLTTSPRVVGEFLRGIGITGTKIADITSALKLNRLIPIAARTGAALDAGKKNIKVRVSPSR